MVLHTRKFDKLKYFAVLVRKKNKAFFLSVPDFFLGGGGCHVGIVHVMNWKAFCLG